MNEKFLAIAEMLNIKAEDVEKAFNEEQPSAFIGLVNSYKDNNVVYSKPDFQTFQSNLILNHEREQINQAKAGKLNPDIYSVIKGSVSEMNEKELAKEMGIDSYTSYSDLISKVKSKGANADTQKILKENEELKVNIKNLDEKLKNIDKTYQEKQDLQTIQNAKESAFSSIKLQYENGVKEKQENLLKSAFNSEHTVKIENGKIVVYKGETPLKTAALEPIPLNDVVKNFATDYGFNLVVPDAGGRGSGNSAGDKPVFKGMTKEAFNKYLVENKIEPNTSKADEIYKKWVEENKV